MATTAHCAYCFEILASDLEHREPLEYNRVQDLWTQHQSLSKLKAAETEEQEGEDGDLQQGDSLEEDSDIDRLEERDEVVEEEEEAPKPAGSSLRLPSINRLQVPSPSSGSSSSTPSSLSATSSRAALGDASKSSSSTSFFSFGSRRSQQPSPDSRPREEAHPLFVTWNTISSRGHKSLRGCIGTFDAQELTAGLRSYALTAAFDDTRFRPVSLSELNTLSNSITLLMHFEPASHALDWDLGTHGIRITFQHHGKRYGATYLPDVAVEQGWTKEETIVSLMRKAGWNGRRDSWRDVKSLNVVRYQGSKATLGWEEWNAWRRWVEGLGQSSRQSLAYAERPQGKASR